MMILSIWIILSGFISLLVNRKHVLVWLLSMELIMLGLLLMLLSVLVLGVVEIVIYYFIMVVCEASLGVSLLVMSVFFYGGDLVGKQMILMC